MAEDSKLYTIHHFEDEPDTMAWIPGVLLNHYLLENPEWRHEDAEIEEEELLSFTLRLSSTSVVLRYVSYADHLAFEKDCKPQDNDIVILDLMRLRGNGELDPIGAELYRLAVSHVDATRVFIVTAYPRQLPESIANGIPAGHLIIKDPDVGGLVRALVATLKLGERD